MNNELLLFLYKLAKDHLSFTQFVELWHQSRHVGETYIRNQRAMASTSFRFYWDLAEEAMHDLDRPHFSERLWEKLDEWSTKTFGTSEERGPVGPLKHLKEEVDEAIATPGDFFEYADCLILIFDAARRAGMSHDNLMRTALAKMEINRKRIYHKPDKDEPSFHIK